MLNLFQHLLDDEITGQARNDQNSKFKIYGIYKYGFFEKFSRQNKTELPKGR